MPEATALPLRRSFSVRRAWRPIKWGVGLALLISVTTLTGEGVGNLRGAMVGLYAASQPEMVALWANDQQCGQDAEAQLQPGNPDGYKLMRGEAVPGKGFDDPVARRFGRDKNRLMARCLMASPSTTGSALNNLMVSTSLNTAALNGSVLPPLPATEQAEDTALIAQLKTRTDLAFEHNVLTKAALAHQIRTLCSGVAGQVRCVPLRFAAALDSPDASWSNRWSAFQHPDSMVHRFAVGDAIVAAKVDAGLWKLTHPAAMAAYDHAVITRGAVVVATMEMDPATKLDPTPSPGELLAQRQTQADALINGYDARLNVKNSPWGDPFEDWH